MVVVARCSTSSDADGTLLHAAIMVIGNISINRRDMVTSDGEWRRDITNQISFANK
jgi:hypothetical protein